MNFSTFDLNLLRVLDALLRQGSTVKAARQLGMSQSTVSGALGRLRHSLGDSLFVRHGQGLVPTDFARSLELPVREQLSRLENILAGPPSFDPASAAQIFRLAGSDFFAELLMPRLARDVRKLAPGLRIQLVDLVPERYFAALERSDADLALIPDATFPDWMDRQPLFFSSFTAIARKGHPELSASGIRPGDTLPLDLFCTLGHVVFSPEGKLRTMGDGALAKIGRSRQVFMTVPAFSGVCRAVAESDLISLVPRQFGLKVASEIGIDLYELPFRVEPALIVAAWHRRSGANPAHAWLRNLIASTLSPLNDGEAPLPK